MKVMIFFLFSIVCGSQPNTESASGNPHSTSGDENNHSILCSFGFSSHSNAFKTISNCDISTKLSENFIRNINNYDEVSNSIISFIPADQLNTGNLNPEFNFKFCKNSIILKLIANEFTDMNLSYIYFTVSIFSALFDKNSPSSFDLSNDRLFYTSFCICEFLKNFLKYKIKVTQKLNDNKIFQEENDIAPFIIAHIFNKIALNEIDNTNINELGNLLSNEFKYLYGFTYFKFDSGYLTGEKNRIKSIMGTIASYIIDNSYKSEYLNVYNWESLFEEPGKYSYIIKYINEYIKCSTNVTIPPRLYILNIDPDTKAELQWIFDDTKEYEFTSKLYDILFIICWKLNNVNFKDEMYECIPSRREVNTDARMDFKIMVINLIPSLCYNYNIANINDFFERLSYNPVYNADYFRIEFDNFYHTIKDKDSKIISFYNEYIKDKISGKQRNLNNTKRSISIQTTTTPTYKISVASNTDKPRTPVTKVSIRSVSVKPKNANSNTKSDSNNSSHKPETNVDEKNGDNKTSNKLLESPLIISGIFMSCLIFIVIISCLVKWFTG
ncbi:hypothetical protein TCON_0644 [Astathelohania contejeani]|uniref:Uncharacterized protein n=1 Tax=Astathelohania contejeani TaxID=164912 RepID=A0ABQ7I120_9MICR|nr:hypothetical protein TCON_0644 [Thelohania contejeani]